MDLRAPQVTLDETTNLVTLTWEAFEWIDPANPVLGTQTTAHVSLTLPGEATVIPVASLVHGDELEG